MYEDPAWDEYLSTGVDPTGGELDVEDLEEGTEPVDGDYYGGIFSAESI